VIRKSGDSENDQSEVHLKEQIALLAPPNALIVVVLFKAKFLPSAV